MLNTYIFAYHMEVVVDGFVHKVHKYIEYYYYHRVCPRVGIGSPNSDDWSKSLALCGFVSSLVVFLKTYCSIPMEKRWSSL